MKKRSIAGQLAHDACQKFKKTATKTLAAKLFKENPSVFNNLEHARNTLRYYRGERGKALRKKIGKSVVDTEKQSYNIEIPESDAAPVTAYKLDVSGKGAIIGDVHFPYHDQKSLKIALQYIADSGRTDFLILNGDIIDCYSLSSFVKDPRNRDFASELEIAKDFMRMACGIWGKVIWKMGNHERRWWDYMQKKAPELIGIEALSWPNLVGAAEIGFDVVGWNQVIHAGELTILHGHEYGRTMFSPVNPARGVYIRAHACSVTGHLHRGSQHTEPDVRGRVTSCWSHGCLCDLHPDYAPLNAWDQSFLTMDYKDEWFELALKKIINGRIA